MSKTLRTELELRLAACDSSLRRRVQKYFSDANALHALRAKLKFPSERLAVVETFYGKRLSELTGHDRSLAEEVAVEHRTDRVIFFGEHVVGGRLERLDAAPMLREFHKGFAREIEREIESVRDYLAPAYAAAGLAHDVEAAAPLVQLTDLLRRAREGIESTSNANASHGIASTFNFLGIEP